MKMTFICSHCIDNLGQMFHSMMKVTIVHMILTELHPVLSPFQPDLELLSHAVKGGTPGAPGGNGRVLYGQSSVYQEYTCGTTSVPIPISLNVGGLELNGYQPSAFSAERFCRHLHLSTCPPVLLLVPIIFVNVTTTPVYQINPPNLQSGSNMALARIVLHMGHHAEIIMFIKGIINVR